MTRVALYRDITNSDIYRMAFVRKTDNGFFVATIEFDPSEKLHDIEIRGYDMDTLEKKLIQEYGCVDIDWSEAE